MAYKKLDGGVKNGLSSGTHLSMMPPIYKKKIILLLLYICGIHKSKSNFNFCWLSFSKPGQLDDLKNWICGLFFFCKLEGAKRHQQWRDPLENLFSTCHLIRHERRALVWYLYILCCMPWRAFYNSWALWESSISRNI